MSQQNIPYDGYPSPGALAVKIAWAGDHVGSNNYQQGGYNENAAYYGMGRIEVARAASQSQSGNYQAKIFYPAISSNNESRAPGYNYVTVKWYYTANSVEVANNTNLSAEITPLEVLGV